ncbi:DPP6 N-terminal domain-like protein [Rhynchospora pubera]|uniref:DPP6 N-terminal domain-like protein n=1 Tax=Rhynchospora pubera TaxID=906938 RepID=A0AAV8CFF7_9POAL|nr:DPP6 N-terminal domain-like protein [Rhynchospora pubera]
MGENRGSIAFFATYRPPVPLDIFSCPVPPSSKEDELHLTDGNFFNYDCQVIPPAALKTILRRPKLASEATEADVDSGRLTGLIFVSERENNLEILHIALRFNDNPPKVKVFSLADVYDANTFGGVRLEDSGCIGGGYKVGTQTIDHFLIYVSTKEPVQERRSPWTVVYKTNLRTGETERLTPPGTFDLSPSVSPSGKKVAVASFQGKGWTGEIEDLKTDIYVMNVDQSELGLERKRVIVNGGWPTWGSDNILFFHRKEYYGTTTAWRVFRFNISTGETIPVTPKEFDAVTPAAISENKVAVATIRMKSKFSDVRVDAQYRHIEIFDTTVQGQSVKITQNTSPKADHYNPFVIDGGKRIGYHRCNISSLQNEGEVPKRFHKLDSPHQNVGLFRVSGVFPTFSTDGSKLAFVDNEFKAVWIADKQGLRIVYEREGPDNCFAPVWNQNPEKDILYVCMGPSFNAGKQLDIVAIPDASSGNGQRRRLTKGKFNNAFPSTDPTGERLVFRSTRDGGDKKYKNLYIMEKADVGEYGGKITRLTNGPWVDTHCQWSPRGDWVVFSSTRDKPKDAPPLDNGLDPGYYAAFLVNVNNPSVVVRVVQSGYDIAGHVNHPVFCPDGKSIAFTSDLAAVSADPISLPLFIHSVRPYGDIFTVDIDPDDITKNENVQKFHRVTHSRYEYSTPCWTIFSTNDPNAQWNLLLQEAFEFEPACPYTYPDGGEGWHMTGHLCIGRRCC